MTFWSGEALKERLHEIIDAPNPDPGRIDCAAYTLSVGPEYYVSPTDQTSDAKSRSLMLLDENKAFAIPPGQFAYMQTEERVMVPDNAIAFISIRARYKWKGLVNVSGFHVDPGYKGRLTFAVLNAGPTPIHLRRGEQCFLIWYADLDRVSNSKKTKPTKDHIDLLFVNSIAGELHSLDGLANRIRDTEKELHLRISAVENKQTAVMVTATVALTLLVAVAGKLGADYFLSRMNTPVEATSPKPKLTDPAR